MLSFFVLWVGCCVCLVGCCGCGLGELVGVVAGECWKFFTAKEYMRDCGEKFGAREVCFLMICLLFRGNASWWSFWGCSSLDISPQKIYMGLR